MGICVLMKFKIILTIKSVVIFRVFLKLILVHYFLISVINASQTLFKSALLKNSVILNGITYFSLANFVPSSSFLIIFTNLSSLTQKHSICQPN